MTSNNLTLNAAKFFFVDLIGKILFWPLWWYSLGLGQLLQTMGRTLQEEARRLGLGLWWGHLFSPMFGQTDWQGRLISFLVRLTVGVGRVLVWLLWLVVAGVVVAAWILVLPVAGYFFWQNFKYFTAR